MKCREYNGLETTKEQQFLLRMAPGHHSRFRLALTKTLLIDQKGMASLRPSDDYTHHCREPRDAVVHCYVHRLLTIVGSVMSSQGNLQRTHRRSIVECWILVCGVCFTTSNHIQTLRGTLKSWPLGMVTVSMSLK